MTPDKRNPLSSKTTFQRWLDKNPPTNDPRYNAIRCRNKRWGAWLRNNRPDQFNALYQDYWLEHPEVWASTYDDNPPEETIETP